MRLRLTGCFLAMALSGCDADGKACAAGSSEASWQACNRSCTDKDNRDSCARAKVLAVEVCSELEVEYACRAACVDGHQPACERVKTLAAEQESRRPPPVE